MAGLRCWESWRFRALHSASGNSRGRQWVKAGDRIGEAYVSDVQPSHLRLSLGTAEVTLEWGNEADEMAVR